MKPKRPVRLLHPAGCSLCLANNPIVKKTMIRLFNILFSLFFVSLVLPFSVQAANDKPVQQSASDRPLAVIENIRHWSNRDYTRVSLELSQDVVWESHEIGKDAGKQGRIFIDLSRTKLSPRGVRDITIGDGLLRGVRVAQYLPDVVRVVLDTENIKNYKIFPLSSPARLVIDVRGEAITEISKLEESISANLEPKSEPEKRNEPPKSLEKKRLPPQKTTISKIRRIVVDPGHGGHDSGAVGQGGVREKDVVLSISLKLRDLLKRELGLDVIMTRSTDVFIPLEERTAIANKVNADLFVSVHANAANNHNASGIETYYLNLAKTEASARLAAKENGTTLDKVSVLQAILFDLMANYKLNDSAHLADDVQRALHKKISASYSGVKNLGVKQGPFYVLVGATMPSILVETAFLSHVQEEERLNDPAYQDATAQGIMEGIRAYISSLK